MARVTPVTPETQGGLLRQFREDRGFTQASLGRVARLDQRTISKLELGQRVGREASWRRVAAALGLNPDDLLGVGEAIKQ